ncbi:uncharacterized protein LY79DRAFT_204953 [Colletotrichum navitas]|uniref:Secreted protein n=1 Tax=Colletotrichum navitas TaxID=681940 RepID=A0AAD8VBE9_9PEZI|nr:uncharacterized protein LY79DRAFT_204953 [Colletotrichum navitas]KAK1598998.1 hypothetical protein LY79DRAFT_204953 [Colletotrichum navitas]
MHGYRHCLVRCLVRLVVPFLQSRSYGQKGYCWLGRICLVSWPCCFLSPFQHSTPSRLLPCTLSSPTMPDVLHDLVLPQQHRVTAPSLVHYDILTPVTRNHLSAPLSFGHTPLSLTTHVTRYGTGMVSPTWFPRPSSFPLTHLSRLYLRLGEHTCT